MALEDLLRAIDAFASTVGPLEAAERLRLTSRKLGLLRRAARGEVAATRAVRTQAEEESLWEALKRTVGRSGVDVQRTLLPAMRAYDPQYLPPPPRFRRALAGPAARTVRIPPDQLKYIPKGMDVFGSIDEAMAYYNAAAVEKVRMWIKPALFVDAKEAVEFARSGLVRSRGLGGRKRRR